jgi:hypothetical protein
MSAVADDAVDAIELAGILDLDDPAHGIFEVFHVMEDSGLRIRSRKEDDGDLVWHRDDLEAAINERERRRKEPERDPLPPRVEVEFSDPGSSYEQVPAKRSGSGDDGVSVRVAAEEAGISEGEMRKRLIGKARLAVVNGDLIVKRGDLQRLARERTIPKPSDVKRSDRIAASIGSEEPASDPELDRRVGEAADRIGLDRAEVGLDAAPADPAVEARTAEAAGALGMDPAEVGAKPKRSAADRRAAEVAEKLGIDYPG